MVVYLDGVIALNFLVDWLLLLGVNGLSGHPPAAGRAAAGALLGGGYAGICMLPGWTFLAGGLWRWISLGLVSITAFGLERSAWHRGVLFVVLSMALGGLVVCFDTGNLMGVGLCAAALMLLCRMGFRASAVPKQLVQLRASWQGRSVCYTALQDTGNQLRDPLTGERVAVASAEIANQLAGITRAQLRDPVKTMTQLDRRSFRLIPYQAVGRDTGLLLAIRCELAVNGVKRDVLLAFAPEGFEGMEHQGLWNG